MSMLTAATWVAAFLLVLAGARKVAQPAGAGSALRTARLPSDAWLVRMLGAGEMLLGLAVIVVGGAAAAGFLALAYGSFAVFAQRQRRAGSDCGCFGTTGTPVTLLHVGLNVVAAVVAASAAMLPTATMPAIVSQRPVAGVAAAILVVVTANLVRLLLIAIPDLTAAIDLLQPDGNA